jgi:hypothetical protein
MVSVMSLIRSENLAESLQTKKNPAMGWNYCTPENGNQKL